MEKSKAIAITNKDFRTLLEKYPDDSYIHIEKATTASYNDLQRVTMRLLEVSERFGEAPGVVAVIIAE
jgi:hypothetical protein